MTDRDRIFETDRPDRLRAETDSGIVALKRAEHPISCAGTSGEGDQRIMSGLGTATGDARRHWHEVAALSGPPANDVSNRLGDVRHEERFVEGSEPWCCPFQHRQEEWAPQAGVERVAPV